MHLKDDDLYQLYQRLYFHEIDLRDRIHARVPILLAIVLALIGMQSYMVNSLFSATWSKYEIVLLVCLLGVSVSALIVAVVYIVRSWHGFSYKYLPFVEQLETHRGVLREYYRKYDATDMDGSLAKKVGGVFFNYFVECASCNATLNDKKSERLHVAFWWLIGSMATGFLALVLEKTLEFF